MPRGIRGKVPVGTITAADIEIDYVTALFRGHQGHLAFFTIRMGKVRSHYAVLVNGSPPDTDMKESALRDFIVKHLVGAVHVRTCDCSAQ
jgi:hypothetical protein